MHTDKNVSSETQTKQHKSKRKIIAVAAAVTAGTAIIIGFAVAVFLYSLTAVDPFDYITPQFSGKNGEGRVELTVKKNEYFDKNTVDITYNGKAYAEGLHEGDTLTIRLGNPPAGIRFSPDAKDYRVEGLELYVTDVNALNEKELAAVHKESETLLKENSVTSPGQTAPKLKKMTPESLMLLTDGTVNHVYDLYRAVYQTSSGEKTVYLAAYYQGLMVNGGDNPAVSSDSAFYEGDIVSLGAWYDGTITAFETPDKAAQSLKSKQEGKMTFTLRDLTKKS